MNNTARIVIVAALVVAVVLVIAIKNIKFSPETSRPSRQATTPNADLPRLVDIGAGTCIPCKMMAPILDQLKKEYKGKLIVEFLDIRENPDFLRQYNVQIIPTQIFYDASGKELFRHEAFLSKEDILAKWKELGVELTR
jgi:thioredoxin 1